MTRPLRDIASRLRSRPGVLVDSNILLDVATGDPHWADWSAQALTSCAEHAVLVINPIIYAEVSVRYSTIEALESALPRELYQRAQLPWEAAFLAAKAFVSYRKSGGQRNTPLPDFYIGAHAAIAGLALLTRDAQRYRTYFPTVEILSP